MKTLNKVLSEIYGDRKIEGGEKSFVDKHVIKQFGVIDGKDYAGNPVDGAPYKATNKYYKRSPRHGFDTGADAKVYEDRVVGLMNQLEEANGGPLNEKLMQNIAGKLRARSLRKSLETRSSAYHDMARNADDSAERHAKRANEAPDSGERKFFKNTESGVRAKARRFRNKANAYGDGANKVTPRHAAIIKSMRGK